jgi:leucyl aminopeptidase
MPLEKGYQELLKSEIADIKNVSGKRYAGAITAALFLQEFVNKKPWVHLDIAGPAWQEKGVDLIARGGSGFGVRTILNFLESQ